MTMPRNLPPLLPLSKYSTIDKRFAFAKEVYIAVIRSGNKFSDSALTIAKKSIVNYTDLFNFTCDYIDKEL